MMFHTLPTFTSHIPDPPRFTYPFCYTPHPLCTIAADIVRTYLKEQKQWAEELSRGKMMGVLIVRHNNQRGFLAAFSGTLNGQTRQEYFVPPVFDLMSPNGHFQQEQTNISAINQRLIALQEKQHQLHTHIRPDHLRMQRDQALSSMREEMEQARAKRQALRQTLTSEELDQRKPELERESQFQKAELRRATQRWNQKIQEAEAPIATLIQEEKKLESERKQRSEALQDWLFGQYQLLDAQGTERSVKEIFGRETAPSGTGDCCAPKLLQSAYKNGMKPLCMAEFWVGNSPIDEIRADGHFYPACQSRCKPLLKHMLQGLSLDDNPLLQGYQALLKQFSIVYADKHIVVVRKPAGMLTVPGNIDLPSIQDLLHEKFPQATGPLIVHRLDMGTSGLLVAALTPEAYQNLQQQFLARKVKKTYMALLEKPLPVGQEGEITLPIRPDPADRPRQLVDVTHGKQAITRYKVIGMEDNHARVLLHPITGRTHQLRVHCAHASGLNNPIIGDPLYGHTGRRLMLHAQELSFNHPMSGKLMHFHWKEI